MADDWRNGQRLAPGIYAWHGDIHVDEREFVLAAGGDPGNPADCETARHVAMKTAERLAIPSEVRDG